MGVTRRIPLLSDEKIYDYGEFVLYDNDSGNENNENQEESGEREPYSKCFSRDLLVKDLLNKRNCGNRKLRRRENELALFSYADDEIYFDCSDLLPNNETSFDLLLNDETKMKIWIDFIEKNEEEQNEFLFGIEHSYKRSASNDKNDNENGTRNPLYSADACFARLPIRFKKLFRKRNIPKVFFFHNYRLRQIDLYEAKEEKIMKEKNLINENEEKLRSFFLSVKDKSEEWISPVIPCSFQRLILHGVSRYLLLNSYGVGIHPERIIKVRNLKPYFVPPHDTLVDYICKN
ncbi:unnamed protein product [Dracunculus medinensis]|uniref:R3H domain-containing protein n=1 Tax=Dracunculus medinensis TaxID=318479 RepID=A0A158Q6E6_DRAME|nr:unnamed protein product [Dracunculus medinensis]